MCRPQKGSKGQIYRTNERVPLKLKDEIVFSGGSDHEVGGVEKSYFGADLSRANYVTDEENYNKQV